MADDNGKGGGGDAVGSGEEDGAAVARPSSEEAAAPAAAPVATSSSSAASAAAAASSAGGEGSFSNNEATRQFKLKRFRAFERLTQAYGFDPSAAEDALDATATGVAAADDDNRDGADSLDDWVVRACDYLLDVGGIEDKGGPVTPITNCPHVADHVKLSLRNLPRQPALAPCTHYCDRGDGSSVTGGENVPDDGEKKKPAVGNLKVDPDEASATCPGGENWLCLECGVVRCGRYINGHGLAHWQETQEQQKKRKQASDLDAGTANLDDGNDSDIVGHCIAASLADLSVWCHVCGRYVKHPAKLDPIVSTLEQLKFGSADGGSSGTNSGSAIASDQARRQQQPDADGDEEMLQPHERQPDRKKARSTPMSEDEVDDYGGGDGDYRDGEGGDGSDNDDDDEEEEEEEEDDASGSSGGARSAGVDVAIENDEDLVEVLRAAAAARGIPLAWILQHAGLEPESGEDEDIEYPFESLPSSLEDVANFIKSDRCRSILILAGAGMSVASGIPDFRSADGLYATMNPDLLTANEVERRAMRVDPTVALDRNLFVQNPLPCLELNREFILGTRERRWKATLAHRFVELLHSKTGKLARLYTQNIDGLEDQCTQLPRSKVIAVHGSMDRAECAMCETEVEMDAFADSVRRQIKDLSGQDPSAPPESTPVMCPTCGCKTMKPAIVLFRSSLPKIFFESVPEDVKGVDLLIVLGTSLQVAPANSIVWRVPKSAMRVLVNREPVGLHLGLDFDESTTKRDYFAEGNCEDVLLELMTHLGWLDELDPLLSNGQLPESSTRLLEECLKNRDSSSNGGNSIRDGNGDDRTPSHDENAQG